MRQVSMATRDELLAALTVRFGQAVREDKVRILTEFVALTGYHRKHAARLLRGGGNGGRSAPRPRRRLHDDAVREALILLWEASDRICGKRLKPLIPMLVAAMERHGHLALDPAVRERLEEVSAATIDRLLAPVRQEAGSRGRRRRAPSSEIRRAVPIRTYADWNDPPPGFEADPSVTGRQFLNLLQVAHPDAYPDYLVRTVQRRLKIWRRESARAPVLGRIDTSASGGLSGEALRWLTAPHPAGKPPVPTDAPMETVAATASKP